MAPGKACRSALFIFAATSLTASPPFASSTAFVTVAPAAPPALPLTPSAASPAQSPKPPGTPAATTTRVPSEKLLSSHGCGRATGYAETNKIVTVSTKTHVAWLDSTREGFRVRIRTLDRATNTWSPTYAVGEAYDNHGGAARSLSTPREDP